MIYFCRGGSHSSMVILNEKGDIVGKSVGPDTNVWVNILMLQSFDSCSNNYKAIAKLLRLVFHFRM